MRVTDSSSTSTTDRPLLAGQVIFHPALSLGALIITWLCGCAALYAVFCVAPDEAVMGPVQRIFYFHVPSALATYVGVFVLLLGSCLYLATSSAAWDRWAHTGAKVGAAFATIVLLTGTIWGHSAWNTWWQWEPRLTSFLVLWLILAGYLFFRWSAPTTAGVRRIGAVLGILSAAQVPLVVLAIRLRESTAQLHPQVAGRLGLGDSRYVLALALSSVAVFLIAGVSLMLVQQLALVRADAEDLRRIAEYRPLRNAGRLTRGGVGGES